MIDGDSVIERDAMSALMSAVLPRSTDTVAAGGTVRIVNGCVVSNGAVMVTGLPRSFIGTAQVLEYLRAFLFGEWPGASSIR